MNPDAYYTLMIGGRVPVTAELVQDLGEEQFMRIRLGGLQLVLPPELADDLADSIIEAEADRAAPITLVR